MKKSEFSIYMPIFLINWDSLSLNSHYESWSYKKKEVKNNKSIQKKNV